MMLASGLSFAARSQPSHQRTLLSRLRANSTLSVGTTNFPPCASSNNNANDDDGCRRRRSNQNHLLVLGEKSPAYLTNQRSSYSTRGWQSPVIARSTSLMIMMPNCASTAVKFKSTAALDADEDGHVADDHRMRRRQGVRNVAIIAHVDHGKTTLVDQLLKAAGATVIDEDTNNAAADPNSTDRLLDSGDLEKERGITITSKVTRLEYYSGDDRAQKTIINVVDTPGHSDFSGEVDRVLSLVDGVCLVVDAGEGPMSQTKYVLSRALSRGLYPPLLILNKVDRPEAMAKLDNGETENQLELLMKSLMSGNAENNLDTASMEPVTLYASARDGWITNDPFEAMEIVEGSVDKKSCNMTNLLDAILEHTPEPTVAYYGVQDNEDENTPDSQPGDVFAAPDQPFSMAAVTVGYDQYLGRTCTGRIHSGSIQMGDELLLMSQSETEGPPSTSTLAGVFVNKGISRIPLEPSIATAGDIVTLAGVPDSIAVGDTVTKSDNPAPHPVETPPLAPPTLSMQFGANTGPLAGSEGTIVTGSKVRERLISETDNNVTLRVSYGADSSTSSSSDQTTVFARGELQLGILIEQMRREGFELLISPPTILTKNCPTTDLLLEPFEEVTVDVDTEYAGSVVSALTADRKGVLLEMTESSADAKTRLLFEVPSRGLLGFSSEVATMTRGSAVVNHVFLEDRPHVGHLGIGLERPKLISSDSGKATTYALSSLAARGTLYIAPGDIVYPGMIIGETSKTGSTDMEVNPVRAKAATNIRTVNKDEKVYLAPPKRMTVEELIGYMSPDEVIEVTPKGIRLRKAELDPTARKKASKIRKQQSDALKRK